MWGSTMQDVHQEPPRGGRWARRVSMALLIAVLLLGASGLLGNHNRTIATTDGDLSMSLEYPRTARAGLDVPWQLTLSYQGGSTTTWC